MKSFSSSFSLSISNPSMDVAVFEKAKTLTLLNGLISPIMILLFMMKLWAFTNVEASRQSGSESALLPEFDHPCLILSGTLRIPFHLLLATTNYYKRWSH
ncbi:unnamed protein product [Lactuca virosa]|uniref:Uncharacterized protein n=1 Tax=Lactuca virosa TaxID=75947 RepID=A0AAU9LFA5_9ASTR|nr:unnamed protein product [Lactuca virosa]